MKVCILGASGTLAQYLVQHAPDRGYEVVESNLTRRVDFALFMVDALENDELAHEAPAIVGRQTLSALAHAAGR